MARLTSAKIRAVLSHRDIHELQEVENTEGTLRMNDIGRVTFTTREVLAVDRYADVPATGAFILIDEAMTMRGRRHVAVRGSGWKTTKPA